MSSDDDPFCSTFRAEAEELGALASALSAKTDFALLVGRIATPRHRQRIEDELSARVEVLRPGCRLMRLELAQPIENLLQVVAKAVLEQRPDAILISGLEGGFSDLASGHGQRMLEQLDAERARFSSDVRCPLLVWLPLSILRALVHYAPGMFRSLAQVYFFNEPNTELDPVLSQLEAASREQEARAKRLRELTGQAALSEAERISLIVKNYREQGPQRRIIVAGIPFMYSGHGDFLALGEAALRTRSFHLAVAAYEKAGRTAAAGDDPTGQIHAHLGRADAHKALGDFPQAVDADQFALMLAKGFNEKELMKQAANHLQDLCRQICTLRRTTPEHGPAVQSFRGLHETARQPTRDSLRALLQATVINDSGFNLFCLEHFMEFAAKHSMALDHSMRMELLLQTVEPKKILAAISESPSARVLINNGHLLKFE